MKSPRTSHLHTHTYRTFGMYFTYWLLATALITVFYGTIYVAFQQTLRRSADQPQMQMAEDEAIALSHSAVPTEFVNVDKGLIDPTYSLAPFTIIYNEKGNVIASNGTMKGHALTIPRGVYTYTTTIGEDRVTWEPVPGVRIAMVSVPYTKGIVVIGRSLREVEKIERFVLACIQIGWLLSFITISLFILFYQYITSRHERPHQTE